MTKYFVLYKRQPNGMGQEPEQGNAIIEAATEDALFRLLQDRPIWGDAYAAYPLLGDNVLTKDFYKKHKKGT